MKSLALALVATLATSLAFAAPHERDPGRRRPGPVQPRPGRPKPAPPGRPVPPPHRDEVVRLGGTKLSPIRDADTIRVNSCAADEAGRISDLRIKAVKHSSHIDGLQVAYGNGQTENIQLDLNLRPGQTSRWIDLLGTGRGRCVRAIRIFGSSRSIGLKKAEVDIYGLRAWRSQLDLQDRREEN